MVSGYISRILFLCYFLRCWVPTLDNSTGTARAANALLTYMPYMNNKLCVGANAVLFM